MFLYVSLVLHGARRSHLARQPYEAARPPLFQWALFRNTGFFAIVLAARSISHFPAAYTTRILVAR